MTAQQWQHGAGSPLGSAEEQLILLSGTSCFTSVLQCHVAGSGIRWYWYMGSRRPMLVLKWPEPTHPHWGVHYHSSCPMNKYHGFNMLLRLSQLTEPDVCPRKIYLPDQDQGK